MSADARIKEAHAALLEEGIAAGRVEPVEAWCSPAHALHQPIFAALPAGRDGLKALVLLLRRAFSDRRVRIDDELGEGDRWVTRFTLTARHTGTLGAIEPRGLPVEVTGLFVSRFDAEGRIAESWLEVSMLSALRQLGAVRVVNSVALIQG